MISELEVLDAFFLQNYQNLLVQDIFLGGDTDTVLRVCPSKITSKILLLER